MSLFGGITDWMTGGSNDQAATDLDQALAAINGVQTPTQEEMQYQLQQYVNAGILTPEQAQTYLQSPNALSSEKIDQTGTDAQQQAIAELMSAYNEGGLNPEEQSQIDQIKQQLNTQEKGANDAAVQNQAARGALTSGETLASQLQNNQNATVNANQLGSATAGQAYQDMLNEISSAGTLGANLQGQQNTQSNTVAAATNAINQFNAAQQQNQENLNVGNRNQAQAQNLNNAQTLSNANTQNANAYSAYNAQLPQQVYNDQLQKADAVAGIYGKQAEQATNVGKQNLGTAGVLTGAGASTIFGGNNLGGNSGGGGSGGGSGGGGGGAAAGSLFSDLGSGSGVAGGADAAGVAAAYDGGEIEQDGVHNYLSGGPVLADRPQERARVPGNSPKNDTVPAKLSPGEIVLPRTVAQHPTQDRVMSFLQRMRKPQPQTAHPDDVATVLHALGKVRNG